MSGAPHAPGEREAAAGRVVRLDPAVVAQIAAGEMILRPFSVAKELLENSLDAGANRIEVAIGESADQSLTVTDNGIGMDADDLLLALESHATSKLRREEDLLRVSSLGFRGEALPSIARVSRLEIQSAADESGEGRRVVVEGGHRVLFEPAPRTRGTTVRVEDLFFNSPVRKRFLRGPAGETRMITRLVSTYALAFPSISFRLLLRSEPVLELPAAGDLRERIAQIHGPSFTEKILEIANAAAGLELSGCVGIPELARPGTQHQTVLVNRRWVTTPWVSAALRQGFGDLIPPNRNPFAVVRLELDPSRVDVNLHPTKREVRFLDESRLFGELVRSVREQTVRLIPTWDLDPKSRGGGTLPRGPEAGGGPTIARGPGPRGALDGQGVLHRLYGAVRMPDEEAALSGSAEPEVGRIDPQGGPVAPPGGATGTHPGGTSGDATWRTTGEAAMVRESPGPAGTEPSEGDATGTQAGTGADAARGLVPLWQLHHRYVFAQTSQGLLIVDQHAAHERILYERAMTQLQESPATTQQLLFPVVVHLDPEEWGAFQEYREDLRNLGVDAEEFGRQAALLRGVPALWGRDPQGLFREVLGEMTQQTARGLEDRFERLAAGFACRSAIRSGKSLTLGEMNALVDQLFATRVPHGDPHGRPTFIQISLQDLDRRFGRRK